MRVLHVPQLMHSARVDTTDSADGNVHFTAAGVVPRQYSACVSTRARNGSCGAAGDVRRARPADANLLRRVSPTTDGPRWAPAWYALAALHSSTNVNFV
jgi:hypothetical protein